MGIGEIKAWTNLAATATHVLSTTIRGRRKCHHRVAAAVRTFRRACWNMSRTREAPTPTNISINSVPAAVKNGTPASPAMAFASSVLPVPEVCRSNRRSRACQDCGLLQSLLVPYKARNTDMPMVRDLAGSAHVRLHCRPGLREAGAEQQGAALSELESMLIWSRLSSSMSSGRADVLVIVQSVSAGAGPTPGGPTSRTPAGERAPMRRKRSGSRRKVTSSISSAFTCSMPAMSANVVRIFFVSIRSRRAPPNNLREAPPRRAQHSCS